MKLATLTVFFSVLASSAFAAPQMVGMPNPASIRMNFITVSDTMYRYHEPAQYKHVTGKLSDFSCMYACFKDKECKYYMRNDAGLCFNYSGDITAKPNKIRTVEKGTTIGIKVPVKSL
jgi:hypothetical protein